MLSSLELSVCNLRRIALRFSEGKNEDYLACCIIYMDDLMQCDELEENLSDNNKILNYAKHV